MLSLLADIGFCRISFVRGPLEHDAEEVVGGLILALHALLLGRGLVTIIIIIISSSIIVMVIIIIIIIMIISLYCFLSSSLLLLLVLSLLLS